MGCQNNSKETNEASSQVSEDTQEETKSESKEKVIKIAGTASVSEVFYEAFKEKYEAMGYQTEFIAFDSNPMCLEACASGETDISLGQQKKFVQSYNTNNGADLDMVKPYGMFTGIGLYSEKYESIDDIPDGSQIAVMNDATNEDVSLKILETAGLIKLSDDVEFVTVADITENPKNLEIIEMEQAQTVTALDDMAAACCWFTHMSASGKDPSSYLIRDEVMINYPMGVIANAEDAASDWAVAMAECLRDPEVQAAIDEVFPNVFEFYTSDEQVEE
ncbi:MAG: methionine-binding protein [Dorea sp.]|nr:methionine-binding protein [Dorea sp.]